MRSFRDAIGSNAETGAKMEALFANTIPKKRLHLNAFRSVREDYEKKKMFVMRRPEFAGHEKTVDDETVRLNVLTDRKSIWIC